MLLRATLREIGTLTGPSRGFREVADYNVSAVGSALVRKEAQRKAGESAF
jgi:hypothetical protein